MNIWSVGWTQLDMENGKWITPLKKIPNKFIWENCVNFYNISASIGQIWLKTCFRDHKMYILYFLWHCDVFICRCTKIPKILHISPEQCRKRGYLTSHTVEIWCMDMTMMIYFAGCNSQDDSFQPLGGHVGLAITFISISSNQFLFLCVFILPLHFFVSSKIP